VRQIERKTRVYRELKRDRQSWYQRKTNRTNKKTRTRPHLYKDRSRVNMPNIPSNNWCGPGMDIKNAGPPVNELDKICKQHDMNYADPNITMKEADEIMLAQLETLQRDNPSISYAVVGAIMNLKHKVDHKTNYFSNKFQT